MSKRIDQVKHGRNPRTPSLRKSGLRGMFNAPAFSMFAVAVLSIWVYWRALGFAFFNDDPTGHFRWMENQSLLQFFGSAVGQGYYRPIIFATLKSIWVLFGGYNAVAFHALLVLLHAVNTALLWRLAAYWGKAPYAWLVALAFAMFPFSYEAVAYVASLCHPLLTFWALLTLLFYHQGRKSNDNRYLVGAHLTLVLGLFTHENCFVVPFILLGWELLTHPVRSLRELLARPVYPFFVTPVLFGILWMSISKSGERGIGTFSAIFSNVLPFLQTLTYPLWPILHIAVDNVLGLLLLSLVTLALTYLLACFARVRRLWGFALAWFLLAAMPSILFLAPTYLYGSPRLHYFASIGAALLWGLPLLALAQFDTDGAGTSARRYLLAGVRICVALAILLPALPFLNCQLDFFAETSRIVRLMSERALAAPPDRDLVYLNLPVYFSSYRDRLDGCQQTYPFTPIGAVLIPAYASVQDFIHVNGGPDRPAYGFTFASYAPGWQTYGDDLSPDALRALLSDAQVYVFDLVSGTFVDLTGVWRVDVPAASAPLAVFDQVVALDDATWRQTDRQIDVTLRWRAIDVPQQSLTVFVHLYDPSGVLVAQHDGPPAGNYAPSSLWQVGDVIDDTHIVVLEDFPASDTFTLSVGLYDAFTGERLLAYSNQGDPLPDDVYVLEYLTWP